MAEPAIDVDGLWKAFRVYHERNVTLKQTVLRRRRIRYERHWALRDVSFDVPEGSTFAIVGSNGSGKSTTLKVLAGILQPDSGYVQVRGRLAALLELGAGFHPELTGRENVFLNGALLGMRRADLEKRFDEIVDFSGLHQFIDNPVKTYSSGMYARLGFAVAINVDPDVLLIDEVLAVGDEEFQQRCYTRIHQLRESGKTIVIVSHGLVLVRQLCDHAAWIDHGVLRALGPVDRVVGAYIDEVHAVDAPIEGRRSGDRPVAILAARACGPDGTHDAPLAPRRPFRLEVDWTATTTEHPTIVELVVRRNDGFALAVTRSKPIRATTGATAGTLVYEGGSLPLVPGRYEVDLRTRALGGAHIDGEWKKALHFQVDTDPTVDPVTEGLVDLGGHWNAT